MSKNGIAILPNMSGVGGPVSFYNRFVQGLEQRSIRLLESPLSDDCNAVLVIGGTRRLDLLFQARKRGIKIVQRLNGMNWMHRKRKTSLRYYLRSELNNRLLAFIRKNLANHIVYQSEFARSWWQTVFRSVPKPNSIVFNGVDLEKFKPEGPEKPPETHIRVLLVEANVSGGYEAGLENAVVLAKKLSEVLPTPIELMVVGNVPETLQREWSKKSGSWITWQGVVPSSQIPGIDRSAHILFSSDLNAACPNSVIEAQACGLPVVSFATGALPELINEHSGKVVPYGADYWNLERPQYNDLVQASIDVLNHQRDFRAGARKNALERFSVERMIDGYLEPLLS